MLGNYLTHRWRRKELHEVYCLVQVQRYLMVPFDPQFGLLGYNLVAF
jgi:hypothetical protein